MVKPRLIGVSGGSGSGKTTLVSRLKTLCEPRSMLILQMDHYYHDLSHLTPKERDERNFDHPDALDLRLLAKQLGDLVAGKEIARPTYDFATHTRTSNVVAVAPAPVIVIDGILSLHDEEIRNKLNLSVYVDVDDDVRFIRRLRRDINERGRNMESVIAQYLKTVKTMHDEFVAPQKQVADIIVSWMNYNDHAVEMLCGMVKSWFHKN